MVSKKTRLSASVERWWPALFLAICAIVGAIVILWPHKSSVAYDNQGLPVDTCQQSSNYTYDCYKQLLGAVVKDKGPQKAFDLIKSEYTKINYVQSQCHQLAHIIGRASFEKYGDLARTFEHGDHYCWAGYYHGALEQLSADLGNDYLLAHANDVCAKIQEQEPYSFNHYNCVHGLGHGFMLVQNNELFSSLKSCDRLTDDYNRTSCYGGVFMQNVMEAYENPNHETKYLKASHPMYPCTAVDSKYKEQCYLMQTSYALQVEKYNFKKVFALCDNVDAAYRPTCYQSTGRDASGRSVSDVNKTKATCLLGRDDEAQRNCVIGAVKDFISYYHDDQKAKQLCAAFRSSIAQTCTSTAANYYQSFK